MSRIAGKNPLGLNPIADVDGAQAEVLIVGAGPVGLMLANLLGRAGVGTLVVEARSATVTEPRAVSIDDEGMRTLQAAGLLDRAEGVVMPGNGTHYMGADGRSLAYVRGPERSRLGFPVKNPIYQPDFERMLAAAVAELESVEVRFGAELVEIGQGGSTVWARVRADDGSEATVRASYAIGCDGGRSRTRKEIGVEMIGSSMRQPWLVVDAINDPRNQRYAIHIGDWRRPTVVLAGQGGRCRYEFMLMPGDDEEEATRPEFARKLLADLRPGVEDGDLIRHTVYNFHALVAERWRKGRVLLAGDAAHMMPPFAGQGLNSGLRDVRNLAWKLTAVLRGEAGPGLLDGYEIERRPHTEATIDLSTRLGRWVMTTSRRRAALRDHGLRLGMRLPPVRRWIEEMRFKPAQRYGEGLVWTGGEESRLLGTMLPQPLVLDTVPRVRPLDDLLGPAFALLAIDVAEPDLPTEPALVERLSARRVSLLTGDRSARERGEWTSAGLWGREPELEAATGTLLLVRPDRIVAAVLRPEQLPALEAALPQMLDLEAGGVPGGAEVGKVD